LSASSSCQLAMTLVAALGTMGVVVGFWGIMGVVEVF
jgi:hypothetical protein